MSTLHLHLMVNHLPIFGTFLGVLVLILALWRKSQQMEIAAYFLFIVSAIGAGMAYLTGDGAEDGVEHLQGIAKSAIDAHEDFAIYPLVLLIILGLVSILGIIFIQKESRLTKKVSYLVLILSVVSFGLIAWTGYLGGQIRHTELNAAPADSQSHSDEGNEPDASVPLHHGTKQISHYTATRIKI